MNRFNLTMVVLVAITVVFFGVNIFQKANYKAVEGDVVKISYNVTHGEDTFTDLTTSVVIGQNTSQVFKDENVSGLKVGDKMNFDTKLTEAETFDETEVAKGETITVDAKIAEVTPSTPVEAESELNSEAASESEA